MVQDLWETVCQFQNRFTIWSSNSTSEYIPKRIESWVWKRYLHTMFTAALFTVATQVSMDRWIDKQNMVYAYNGVFSTSKKGRNSDISSPWMNLENMLSEVSQSQKDQCFVIPLYEVPTQNSQIHRNMVVARGCRERLKWEVTVN